MADADKLKMATESLVEMGAKATKPNKISKQTSHQISNQINKYDSG